MKLKIGILCHSSCGGSARIALESAAILAKRGHEVFLFTRTPPFFQIGHPDCLTYHTLFPENPKDRSPTHLEKEWSEVEMKAMVKQVQEVISNQSLDIIHAHYGLPFIWIIEKILNNRKNSPATVLTLHGTDIEPFLYENEFAQRYTQAIEGIDSLTTVSHAHARRISKESGLKKDIEVIPNFIPLRDFSPTLEKPPLEQPQIIHISNFRQIKNISDVIQTFELILRHIPNAELCLVGDGESMEEAERYARKAGLIKTIRFPGLLKDIPKALVPAHLMLAASQYESFGLVFLEAMACGVPVIAPDIGGIPEVIRHGQTGYLFPPGDYRSAAAFAVNILENKEEYRKVSQRAIIHSQLFGPERAITQYENVYSHILT